MGMPPQIDVHAQITFDRKLKLEAQQADSAFRASLEEEIIDGEKRYFDDYGAASMLERTTRGQANTPQNLLRNRRVLTPVDYEWTEEYDFDKDIVRVRRDMTEDSEYAKAVVATVGRAIDDIIISATINAAAFGKSGESFVNGLSSVGGTLISPSPTIGNLRTTRRFLLERDAVAGKRMVANVQHEFFYDVLSNTERNIGGYLSTINTNIRKSLVDLDFKRWMGFDWFVRSDYENVYAFGGAEEIPHRYNIFRTWDAVLFAMDPDVTVGWEKLPGRGDTWQYTLYMTLAATRVFDNQVIAFGERWGEVQTF